MILKPATESDWESIQRISVQIHDLHAAWRPDIYFHTDEPYPKARFLEDSSKGLLYVARQDNRVLGYVVLAILEKGGPGTVAVRQLRLESICVDETCRGQGIGKAMMAELPLIAGMLNCTGLVLGVHPENQSALRFYQSCGFSVRTINMEKKL